MRALTKDTMLAELRARIARIEGGQVHVAAADGDDPQAEESGRHTSLGRQLPSPSPAQGEDRGGELSAPSTADASASGHESSKARPDRPLPLGVAEIDRRLPGRGLQPGRLHEVVGSLEGAGTGFVIHLLRRLMDRGHMGDAAAATGGDGPVLWCAPQATLYAPGLAGRGLDVDRLVCVVASRREDRLWAMEEALRCQGVAAVVGELRAREMLDLTASRRLQLAAGQGGALALLLRPPPPGLRMAGRAGSRPAGPPPPKQHEGGPADDEAADAAATDLDPGAIDLGAVDLGVLGASAAVTRWHVHPLPLADRTDNGAGAGWDDMGRRARWRLTLMRSRTGARHAWTVEVDHATGDLALAAALRDRPGAAAGRAVA